MGDTLQQEGGVRFWPQRTRFKSPLWPPFEKCGFRVAVWKPVWLIFRVLSMITARPSRSTRRWIPEDPNSRGHLHTHVHSGITHKGQERQQPNCPSKDKWINKMSSIQTREHGSPTQSREALTFAKTRTRPLS